MNLVSLSLSLYNDIGIDMCIHIYIYIWILNLGILGRRCSLSLIVSIRAIGLVGNL